MKRLAGIGLVLVIAGVGLTGCNLFSPPIVELPNARWLDTFEDYPLGDFPTDNWIKSGNAGASENEVFRSTSPVNQVLQLKGVYGGNWSAVAYRAIDLSSSHTISFRVKNRDWGGGTGSHQFCAAVDLMTGPDWTASGRWLIFFGLDGKIHGAPSYHEGLVLGDYAYDEWYDVEIWYQRTQDSTVVLVYDINGTYAGVVEVDSIPEELNLAYLGLWSGDTTVWFDDVGVLPR